MLNTMTLEKKSHTELIAVGTALIVSLTTLCVYIYQTKVMTEQQHVSVWPYVETYSSNVHNYQITARNKGVGPAIIRKVEMAVDGKPVHNNQELMVAVMGDAEPPPFIQSTLEGRVMVPGEEISPLLIPDLKQGRAFEEKLRAHRFEFRITYCSVYGDCWMVEDDHVKRLPKVDLGLH